MFLKPALNLDDQIALLTSRGLIINNKPLAKKYLSNISYYRLGEYWYVLQEDKEHHRFKPNSNFDTVIALYNFDAELRILLFDVIEKIEISLRTKLIYFLSLEFDPWWFQNFDLFIDSRALVKSLSKLEDELSRSKIKAERNILKSTKMISDSLLHGKAWSKLVSVDYQSYMVI